MYCNKETVELAVSKGYKHCTCAVEGYPGCLCGKGVYCPVRLDDIQRWLREKHNIVVFCGTWEYGNGFVYEALIMEKEMDDTHKHICPMDFTTWDEALEIGLVYAMKLIK